MDELPLHVASLDDIPEAYRGLYREADDGNGFVPKLKAAGGFTVEKNIEHLQRALGSAKGEAKKAKDALAKFVDADGQPLDPASVQDALAKLSDVPDDKDVQAKIDHAVRTYQERVEKKHKDELTARETAAAKLRAEVERRVRDEALMEALSNPGEGQPTARNPKLLASYLRDRVKVMEEDDSEGRTRFVAHVIDPETGQRAYGKGTEYATVTDLVSQVRDGELKSEFVVPERKGTTPPRQTGPRPTVEATPNNPGQTLSDFFAAKHAAGGM